MNDTAQNKTCEKCGGDITTEQIVQKQAGLVQGVLLCPTCVEAKRKELLEAHRAAQGAGSAATAVAAAAQRPAHDLTDDKIALVDEEPATTGREAPKIRSFAAGSTLAGAHHDADLKRGVSSLADPPTRIRTFHSKLTPAALAHMDDLINEWIDTHPEVFIKHVATCVGPFEAKHVEQHLIVNIFY